MPYLKINTNLAADSARDTQLASLVSREISAMLGKPESYVMIEIRSGLTMLFAGSDAPLAYLELKSLGLPQNQTTEFSAHLCRLIAEQLGIEPARVYIEFSSPDRHLWGWNGSTF